MSQVQEQPINQPQAAPAQPPVSSTPPPAPQQEPDIFADSFSESDISAMFDADNGGEDGGTPAPAEAPEGTQPPAQQEEGVEIAAYIALRHQELGHVHTGHVAQHRGAYGIEHRIRDGVCFTVGEHADADTPGFRAVDLDIGHLR